MANEKAPGQPQDAERNSWETFVTNYSIPWPGYDNYDWTWETDTKRWKGILDGPTTRWTDTQLRVYSTVYAWGYGETTTDTKTSQNKKKNTSKTIETETTVFPFNLYGKPIPWSGGLRKIKGEILWSGGMTITRKTVGASSDGGTLSASTTTEKARISFAMVFGEGLTDGTNRVLRRVWASDTLIYDQASKLMTELPDIKMRWYSGTDDQRPDRLIQDLMGDQYAVGFRRLMYIVFEEFPADKFGNEIPEIWAEIEDHTARPNVEIPYQGLDTDRDRSTWTAADIDWEQDKLYIYWINPDSGDPDYNKGMISVYSISQEIELFRYSIEDCNQNLRPYVFCIIPHLNVGIQQNGNSNGVEIVAFDLSTGDVLSRWGTAGTDGSNSETNIGIRNEIYPFRLGESTFLAMAGTGAFFHVFQISEEGVLTYLGHFTITTSNDWVKNFAAIGAETGDGIVLFSAGSYIYSFSITTGGTVVLNEAATLVTAEGDMGTELCGGIILPGPTSKLTPEPLWPREQWPIFIIENSGTGGDNKAWRPRTITAGKFDDWEVSDPFPLTTGVQNKYLNNSYTRTGLLFTGVDNTDDAHTLNVRTLEVRTFTTAEFFSSQMFYHSTTHSVVGKVGEGSATAGDNGVGRIFFERAPFNTETLTTFLTEICKRAGYLESEIEIIGLDIPIYGWIVNEVSSLRALLEPLGRAFDFAFFDAPEKIKIIRHTKNDTFTADYTIPVEDMVVRSGTNKALDSTREADKEVPRVLDLTYYDKDNGYELTTVRAQRNKLATAADGVETCNTRIVMKASLAKSAAFRALQTSWTTRQNHEFTLPPAYYRITAGVGIEIQVSDDESFYAKVDRVRKNNDWTVSVTASEMVPDAEFYPNNFGGAGNGSHLPGSLLSDWYIITLRPISAGHDSGGSGLLMYFACAGIGTKDWPGANIYMSFDGRTYTLMGRISKEAITGKLLSLDDSGSGRRFHMNRKASVNVNWTTGQFTDIPASITDAQLVEGVNTLFIGRSQRHWETIFFKEREVLKGNTWKLKKLVRGMLNSDGEIGNNDKGDTTIYYDSESVIRYILPNAQLGKPVFMKAVHDGLDIEDIKAVTFTIDGWGEKPVAVAKKKTIRGTGDRIELRWDRRTRFGGNLQDGTGEVPLNEDYEAYLVEIFNEEGDLVRTVVVEDPEYDYLLADQTADGFSGTETTIKSRIRQISAMIGPGEGDIEDVRVY